MSDALVQDVRQSPRNNADRANREYVVASRGWFLKQWDGGCRRGLRHAKAFEILLRASEISLSTDWMDHLGGPLVGLVAVPLALWDILAIRQRLSHG